MVMQCHDLCMLWLHGVISRCPCVGVSIHLFTLSHAHLVCIMLCVTPKVKGACRSPAPAGKPISGAMADPQQVCPSAGLCVPHGGCL